jgi:hypothetical protein
MDADSLVKRDAGLCNANRQRDHATLRSNYATLRSTAEAMARISFMSCANWSG